VLMRSMIWHVRAARAGMSTENGAQAAGGYIR